VANTCFTPQADATCFQNLEVNRRSFSVASATTGASQLVTTSGSKIRHKIEDFPTYNGAKEIGSDINFWIAVIESKTKSFADKFHDDDYRRIILGRLTGPAKDQLESTSFLFDRCQNWQEMKSYLKQSFEDPSYRLKLVSYCRSNLPLHS
jgi:hypothetical protein